MNLSAWRIHDRALLPVHAAQPVLAVFLVEIGITVTVAQGLLCPVERRFYGGRFFWLCGAQGFDGAVPLLQHATILHVIIATRLYIKPLENEHFAIVTEYPARRIQPGLKTS